MITYGSHPILECSSVGDRRFSAFFAVVDGRTIEAHFQAAKIFEDGSTGLTIKEAKGRHAVNQEEVDVLYSNLWDKYFEENPELIRVIMNYRGFSDAFGQAGHCCQAAEIWRIYNENKKAETKDPEPPSKGVVDTEIPPPRRRTKRQKVT